MATTVSQEEAHTVKTVSEIRLFSGHVKELLKAADKHATALGATVNTGTAFVEALAKVTSRASDADDVADGLSLIGDAFKRIEMKRQAIAATLAKDLVGAAKAHVDSDKADLEAFDKANAASKKRFEKEVKAAEKATKSAGKKGGQGLKDALALLDQKVKAAETSKSDALRDAILMRRKRQATLIHELSFVLSAMADYAQEVSQIYEANGDLWSSLVSQAAIVPESAMAIMRRAKTERTFHRIEAGDVAGADSGEGMGSDFGGYSGDASAFATVRRGTKGRGGGGPPAPPPFAAGGGGSPLAIPPFAGGGGGGGPPPPAPPPPSFGGGAPPPAPPPPPSFGGGGGGPPPPPAPPSASDTYASLPPSASLPPPLSGAAGGGGGGAPPPPAPPPPPSAGPPGGGGGGGAGPPPVPPAGPPPGATSSAVQQSSGGLSSSMGGSTGPPPPPPPSSFAPPSSDVLQRLKALHDVEAEEDGDLAFSQGDIIEVLSYEPGQDWYTGRVDGRVGIFPVTGFTQPM